MMGVGKSALGPVLAQRLGVAFYDSDVRIEDRAGATIPEIFEREGEAGFRRREAVVIEGLCGEAAVVALGGGALEPAGTLERLEACGILVYLRARPETLLARVGEASERPLLAGRGPEQRLERIRELLGRRESQYERAGLVVDTEGVGVERLAAVISERLAEVG
jgi:shikimate kinase